jgi:hypothetical protein
LAPAHSPSSANFATGAQAPADPGRAHDWQAPQAAVPQQIPSTQNPEAQSAGDRHATPICFRHAPPPSHVASPEQASSAPSLTREQVPSFPVSPQLLHAPSQAASQQTPSTQNPLPHCVPAEQARPVASSAGPTFGICAASAVPEAPDLPPAAPALDGAGEPPPPLAELISCAPPVADDAGGRATPPSLSRLPVSHADSSIGSSPIQAALDRRVPISAFEVMAVPRG